MTEIEWHDIPDVPGRQQGRPPLDLLPCPFDGGTRLVVHKVDRYGDSKPGDPDAFAYNVVCTSCATEGPWVKSSPEGACTRWNRRSIHGLDLGAFVVQDQSKSRCPDCGKYPLLLSGRNPEFRLLGSEPFFWLCGCGAIRQSGNPDPIAETRYLRGTHAGWADAITWATGTPAHGEDA